MMARFKYYLDPSLPSFTYKEKKKRLSKLSCQAHWGFTVESLSLFYLFSYLDIYVLGNGSIRDLSCEPCADPGIFVRGGGGGSRSV